MHSGAFGIHTFLKLRRSYGSRLPFFPIYSCFGRIDLELHRHSPLPEWHSLVSPFYKMLVNFENCSCEHEIKWNTKYEYAVSKRFDMLQTRVQIQWKCNTVLTVLASNIDHKMVERLFEEKNDLKLCQPKHRINFTIWKNPIIENQSIHPLDLPFLMLRWKWAQSTQICHHIRLHDIFRQ